MRRLVPALRLLAVPVLALALLVGRAALADSPGMPFSCHTPEDVVVQPVWELRPISIRLNGTELGPPPPNVRALIVRGPWEPPIDMVSIREAAARVIPYGNPGGQAEVLNVTLPQGIDRDVPAPYLWFDRVEDTE